MQRGEQSRKMGTWTLPTYRFLIYKGKNSSLVKPAFSLAFLLHVAKPDLQ